MTYIFPKSSRLLKNWEYQQVWKMGCRTHTPHFILLRADNTENRSRVGITVSRKVGNAVTRNRVKRYLREYFRHWLGCTSQSLDISVIAKKGAAQLSLQQIFTELNYHFD